MTSASLGDFHLRLHLLHTFQQHLTLLLLLSDAECRVQGTQAATIAAKLEKIQLGKGVQNPVHNTFSEDQLRTMLHPFKLAESTRVHFSKVRNTLSTLRSYFQQFAKHLA